MTCSLIKYFEGKLDRYSQHVSRVHELLDSTKITKKALPWPTKLQKG